MTEYYTFEFVLVSDANSNLGSLFKPNNYKLANTRN